MKTIYAIITLFLILVITSGCGLLPQQSGNHDFSSPTPY